MMEVEHLSIAGATLKVDLDALIANFRLVAARSAPAEIAAVVKADGYGLGAVPIAVALAEAGCRHFFVAQLSEAMALKPHLPNYRSVYINTNVRLIRGSLLVSGDVRWSAGQRCGVRFTSLISVRDWMTPPVNAGQAYVDAVVLQVRAGALTGATFLPSQKEGGPSKALRARLTHVSALIDELGNALCDDELVVTNHGAQLQKIDMVLQLLAGILKDDEAG